MRAGATPVRNDLQTWERAEIARSDIEAIHAPAALQTSVRNIARYLDPPAGTAYPLEYAFHTLGDVRGRRVLDLGCGSGMNSLLLAHRGAVAVGLDISVALLRLARQRFAVNGAPQPARFLVGSAHGFPFADESIDAVLGIAILHHLDLDLVAREVHRVLRPGGRAVFQEPVRNSRLLAVLRRLVPLRDEDVSPYERPLTFAELARFASRFRVADTRLFGLPPVRLGHRIAPLRSHLDRLYAADASMLRRHPWLRRYASICVLTLEK